MHLHATILLSGIFDSSLSGSQTGGGGRNAALGAHDGSAFAVPQEVDQSSSLNGMLAGLGDGHAHGDLGEAAVGLVAELDLLTDGEAGVVSQSRLVLVGGRIPAYLPSIHS